MNGKPIKARELTTDGKTVAWLLAIVPGFFMIWLAPGPVFLWMVLATATVRPIYRLLCWAILYWPAKK